MREVTEAKVLESSHAEASQRLVQTEAAERPTATCAFFFLLLFTVVVYARPQDILPFLLAFHLPLAFGVCAGVAYLTSVWSRDSSLYFPRELQIVLILTLWYIAGIPFALWKGGSLEVLTGTWVKTVFALFLLTQTLVTLTRIRLLLWALILSESIITSITLLDRQHATWEGQRLAGFNQGFFGWNYFGIAVSMTVPYLAVLFLSSRSIVKTSVLAATCSCLMWMLMLTASRGGVLTVSLSVCLTSILILRHSSRGRTVLVMIALSLIVALVEAPPVLWTRMSTLWGSFGTDADSAAASAEESTQGRELLLQRSIQYTLEHPVFGLGLGNFAVANGTDIGQPGGWAVTHNTFTQVSSEGGIPALLLFVWLLLIVIRNMKTIGDLSYSDRAGMELRLMARATFVSIVAFAFGGLFASLSYDYYLFYAVAVAAGLRAIAQEARKAPRTVPNGVNVRS